MKSVAVAAPNLARTPAEADLLIGSVERLARHGLPVYLADGGSVDGFVQRLSEIPGVQVQATEATGLVAQVRQALAMAQGNGCTHDLYTEPDKHNFFNNRLAEFLQSADAMSLCFPSRTDASLATFPTGQQTPERLFNTLAAQTLGVTSDFLYGPLLFPIALASYLEEIPADLGWGWRIFLLTVAVRLGVSLMPCEADLPCPHEQRGENDDRAKTYRIEQMAQNIRGLALGRRQTLPE